MLRKFRGRGRGRRGRRRRRWRHPRGQASRVAPTRSNPGTRSEPIASGARHHHSSSEETATGRDEVAASEEAAKRAMRVAMEAADAASKLAATSGGPGAMAALRAAETAMAAAEAAAAEARRARTRWIEGGGAAGGNTAVHGARRSSIGRGRQGERGEEAEGGQPHSMRAVRPSGLNRKFSTNEGLVASGRRSTTSIRAHYDSPSYSYASCCFNTSIHLKRTRRLWPSPSPRGLTCTRRRCIDLARFRPRSLRLVHAAGGAVHHHRHRGVRQLLLLRVRVHDEVLPVQRRGHRPPARRPPRSSPDGPCCLTTRRFPSAGR